jgi:hypothetical protein
MTGLAIDFDMACGLFDETIHHAEAEPCTLPFRLGGEKRLEHALDDIRCHAAARIRQIYKAILTLRIIHLPLFRAGEPKIPRRPTLDNAQDKGGGGGACREAGEIYSTL